MVPTPHISLFRHLGDKMAAGNANKSPLMEVVILFMLEERRPPLQVGQVVQILLKGVFI